MNVTQNVCTLSSVDMHALGLAYIFVDKKFTFVMLWEPKHS